MLCIEDYSFAYTLSFEVLPSHYYSKPFLSVAGILSETQSSWRSPSNNHNRETEMQQILNLVGIY